MVPAIASVRMPERWLIALKTRALMEKEDVSTTIRRALQIGCIAEGIDLSGLGSLAPPTHSPAPVETLSTVS
jgi:hypothetical protein